MCCYYTAAAAAAVTATAAVTVLQGTIRRIIHLAQYYDLQLQILLFSIMLKTFNKYMVIL